MFKIIFTNKTIDLKHTEKSDSLNNLYNSNYSKLSLKKISLFSINILRLTAKCHRKYW